MSSTPTTPYITTDDAAPARRAGGRSTAAVIVAVLSAIAALGALLLCVGHLGVDLGPVSALGPGGTQAVPVAATIFAVGAVLFAALAVGTWRGARWAWWAGVVVYGLATVSGITQYRGAASAIGLVVSVGALAALLSPSGRRLRG